ncbi:YALI0D05687p KAB8284608.1 6-O-methylguanine DNA methyltransferase [Lipomyces doorenjongii]|uniref:YALI0D05687p KAB8284608.1 6-O-methylguanine DNA methyltransferase n=1 Tax=Lipomyces doorenjongii TaxID=383834 RepID=UPI0034CDC708
MAKPRTDEAEAFYIAVYETVQRIPPGRVTTYGHVARLIDAPQNSRQVGSALKYLHHAPLTNSGTARGLNLESDDNADRDESDSRDFFHQFNSEIVPWWRVISADGRIAFRASRAMDEQGERLQAEGVDVRNDAHSRPRVINLHEYGWFPPPEEELSD